MARLPDENALGRAGSFRSGRAILRQEAVGTSGAGQIIAKAVEGFGATGGRVARQEIKRREKAREAEAALARVVEEKEQQRDATDAIRATTAQTRGLNEIAARITAEPDFSKHGQLFEKQAARLAAKTGRLIGNADLRKNFQAQAERQTDSFRTRILANAVRAEREAARGEIDSALQTHFDLYVDPDAAEPRRVQALAQLNDMIALAGARGLFTPDEAEDKRQRFVFGAVKQDAALQVARDPQGFLAELEVKDGRYAVLPAQDRVDMARAAAGQAVAAALDADPGTIEQVLTDPLVAKNLGDEQQDKARQDARVSLKAREKREATQTIRAFAAATPALVARANRNETFKTLDGTEQRAGPPLSVAEADAMIARLKQGGASPEAMQLHEELHANLIVRGGAKQAPLEPQVFGELMQSISTARIVAGKPIDVEASVTALVDVQARVLRAQRLGQITSAQAESMLTRAIPAVMAQVERDGGTGGAQAPSAIAALYESGFALISDLLDGTDEANTPALKASLFAALADTIAATDPETLKDPETKAQAQADIGRAIRRAFDGIGAGQAFGAPLEFPEVANFGSGQRGVPLPDRNPQREGDADEPAFDLADALDALELVFDAAGMLPGVGVLPDAASAGLSHLRGDQEGAKLSAAAMLPIAGQAAGAAKIARKLRRLKRKTEEFLGKQPGASGGERAYKRHTQGVKKASREENRRRNKGELICPECDAKMVDPTQRVLGKKVDPREAQSDHKFPRSRGGDGATKKDMRNIGQLCTGCNNKKSNKLPFTLREALRFRKRR